MKRAIRRIALALFSATLVFASFSVFAAQIVIDSGDSATIISSLPDAAAQEEHVCSDTFNGILGKCSGPALGILGFYTISHPEFFTAPDSGVVVTTACDDGDIAISAGFSHNSTPGLQVTSSLVSPFNPREVSVEVFAPTEGDSISLFGICADYFPAHES